MSTERFNFKAKPGEPGFRQLPKNKYGHTVLNPKEEELEGNYSSVNVEINSEGEISAVGSMENLLQSPHIQAWAEKNNIAILAEPEIETVEEPEKDQMATLSDEMDRLLEDSNEHQASEESADIEPTTRAEDTRVRKVSATTEQKTQIRLADNYKRCVDTECNTIIPAEAKFCSTCGKSQQVAQFCIECGYSFRGQEKFCPLCGNQR